MTLPQTFTPREISLTARLSEAENAVGRLTAENERLRAALESILKIEDDRYSADWAEIEEARLIARDALAAYQQAIP